MNIFTKIYEENLWNSQETKSGIGSELQHTEILRKELFTLFRMYNIGTILDIPCGDYNWMKEMDLDGMNISYIGADIVKNLINPLDQALEVAYGVKKFTDSQHKLRLKKYTMLRNIEKIFSPKLVFG